MFIDEELLHYVIRFLDRYDIKVKPHSEAVKQFRAISDELIEKLYKPAHINVIRKPKPKDEKAD